MQTLLGIARFTLRTALAMCTAGVLMAGGAYLYLAPKLPSIESLKDVRLQVPLRVYTRDSKLIAEFGEKRRAPVKIEEVPELMVKAVLAAEDDRYFEHPGVDYQGILRAAFHLVKTGEKGQGGSTITMQVARNFFLSSEKTFLRKLNEIFLALKIERELTKEEILELYLNKIYLGNRAYGVAAAAQVYYGKPIDQLDIAQMAMIAGLPKAPSRYNPIVNPQRAVVRRNYVLGRMHSLGSIDDATYQLTSNAPVSATLHGLTVQLDAPYVAEMVRNEMVERFGNDTYTVGYNVYTTVNARLQQVASGALRGALLAYDRRHGYRGPEGHVTLEEQAEADAWRQALGGYATVGGLVPGLVVATAEQSVAVYVPEVGVVEILWPGLSWARPYIDVNRRGPAPRRAGEVVAAGDIVRLEDQGEGQWRLSQVPQAEGALVSLDPRDGSILALVGGFDYYHSKFNRAVQAERQPGSSFKPFIYSAALEQGFTAASLINDAPVVFEDPGLEAAWRPENYSGKFYGPTRLRLALTKSRNLVSIRLLRSIGVGVALDYAARFGFRTELLPRDLSLALGSGTVAPLELARGYAVFANGGYLIDPYLIDRIEGPDGAVIMRAEPATVCPECELELARPAPTEGMDSAALPPADGDPALPGAELPAASMRLAKRVVEARNAYLMTSMMRDVIRYGTGRRALRLGRKDLAGKTGTTNDQRDAWFSGFNSDIVATAWVGFDKTQPLGDRETGSRAALPMWNAFMREALKGMVERPLQQPPGLVSVRIDPETGLLAGVDHPKAQFETFRSEFVPKRGAEAGAAASSAGPGSAAAPTEQLF